MFIQKKIWKEFWREMWIYGFVIPLAVAGFFIPADYGWLVTLVFVVGGTWWGYDRYATFKNLKIKANAAAESRARNKIRASWDHLNKKKDAEDRIRALLLEVLNALNAGLPFSLVDKIVDEESPDSGYFSDFTHYGVDLETEFEVDEDEPVLVSLKRIVDKKPKPPYARLLLVSRNNPGVGAIGSTPIFKS